MNGKPSNAHRDFVFEPTAAVAASRARGRFVDCPVCRADHSEYLFHRVGVRFVRCRSCGMVYVNPTTEGGTNYFDLEKTDHDQKLASKDFEALLGRIRDEYARAMGRVPRRALLVGRWLPRWAENPVAREIGLEIVTTDDAAFRGLTSEAKVDWVIARCTKETDLVLLNDFLEAASGADAVIERLLAALPPTIWIAATYSNAQSLPARMLRRHWPPFFDLKSAFFNTGNLTRLMARHGLVLVAQFPVGAIPSRIRTGTNAALFRRKHAAARAEKLSVVFPVYNEATYVREVLEALLSKRLKIEKEIIVVESNSTDGTREIVQSFESRPGVRVLYEERPQGKGHAVKTGLAAVTGTIVLVQDADFEYDLDDYDALIEPILQHRTTFVLGSRSLGLDDWKVRRFEGNVVKRFLLNAAQVGFAKTFNALYRENVTDVNTMFKVFRAECLEGLNLESDGFNLDIELACKLTRNGNSPMEVPVNYVARGFEEGKKISFVRDALPSYAAFFKWRFKR